MQYYDAFMRYKDAHQTVENRMRIRDQYSALSLASSLAQHDSWVTLAIFSSKIHIRKIFQ